MQCSTFVVAQQVKNPPGMQETWVWSLVEKIPWRREQLPIPVFWPGEFRGLCSPWVCREWDTTERLSFSLGGTSRLQSSTLEVKSWHECKRQKEAQLQFVKPEWGNTSHLTARPRGSQPQGSQLPQRYDWAWDAAHTFLGSWAAWLIWQTHNPVPTPLGEHTTHLRLWQLPTDLCCSGYSSHIPAVSALSLPLPSLTEQMSLNKLLLLPLHVWAGNCYQSVTYKQRQGQTQSEVPGVVRAKERRGNCSWASVGAD